MLAVPTGMITAFRVLLALAVCGGATTVLGDPVDNIAANILTPEVAQRILGRPVEAAARNSNADMHNGANVVSQAGYNIKDGDSSAPRIGVTIRRFATVEEAKSAFAGSKGTYSGVDVAEIGDAAYRIATPAQFNVLKGRDWIIITAGVFPKADPALQEKAAREILANIHD